MQSEPLVLISPEVMSGTPVFYGTRVPIKTLVDYLRAGKTIDVFLDHFPTVKRDQVIQFLEIGQRHIIEETEAHAYPV